MSKHPFAVIASDAKEKTVTTEADYWDGPVEAGQKGRYVRRRFVNQWIERREYVNPITGERKIIPGHALSAAKSVSYYPQLLAAFAKIGCRP